jgi:alpha-ketoglutarate-dependent taurine dioxygenase
MAKITGPLMSLDARGAFARRLTFSHVTSGSVVKKFSEPAKRVSAAQTTRRTLYQDGIAAWKNLTPEEQQVWNGIAQIDRMTGFNIFMRAQLTPSAPAGTIWDSGTTTWDSGMTLWDI